MLTAFVGPVAVISALVVSEPTIQVGHEILPVDVIVPPIIGLLVVMFVTLPDLSAPVGPVAPLAPVAPVAPAAPVGPVGPPAEPSRTSCSRCTGSGNEVGPSDRPAGTSWTGRPSYPTPSPKRRDRNGF